MDQVKFFKGCLPQVLIDPLLNTLFQIEVGDDPCQNFNCLKTDNYIVEYIRICSVFEESCNIRNAGRAYSFSICVFVLSKNFKLDFDMTNLKLFIYDLFATK